MLNEIKFYNIKNNKKKYSLKRVLVGVMTPIILSTALTGCINQNNIDKYTYNETDSEIHYYDQITQNTTDSALTTTTSAKETTTTSTKETTTTNSTNNKKETYELNDITLNIINSNITIDSVDISNFLNYVESINVEYPNSQYFNIKETLYKYNALKKYKSNFTNLFSSGQISADELYNIVLNNNNKSNFSTNAKMSNTELKKICVEIANVLNNYVKNNSDADLLLLSEKVSNLKIKKFTDFSNGYYDTQTGTMGFSVEKLNSDPDFYKKTIEHETYHFIQANSLKEIEDSSLELRLGPSYKFKDLDNNALHWKWYTEGCAEYLMMDNNDTHDSEVYGDVIMSFDSIKLSNIFDEQLEEFEKTSLNSNLNSLFEYFDCKTEQDQIEILNMMYSFNIIHDINSSSENFYNEYQKVNGIMQYKDKSSFLKQLKGSIAQTLTKQFYAGLGEKISNNNINIEEIFSMISVFENELSRLTWYQTPGYEEEMNKFFETYNNIQTNLFELIAQNLNLSLTEIQYAYNSYNLNYNININDIDWLSTDKEEFCNYILETRKNDKTSSINQISGRR